MRPRINHFYRFECIASDEEIFTLFCTQSTGDYEPFERLRAKVARKIYGGVVIKAGDLAFAYSWLNLAEYHDTKCASGIHVPAGSKTQKYAYGSMGEDALIFHFEDKPRLSLKDGEAIDVYILNREAPRRIQLCREFGKGRYYDEMLGINARACEMNKEYATLWTI